MDGAARPASEVPRNERRDENILTPRVSGGTDEDRERILSGTGPRQ
jgi:hypothetical protein